MSLATRCPVCSTVFRVVQDQLKVSEGWVRCGRCAKVFNAFEGLFDLERELSTMAPPQVSPSQRVLEDLAQRNRQPRVKSDFTGDEFPDTGGSVRVNPAPATDPAARPWPGTPSGFGGLSSPRPPPAGPTTRTASPGDVSSPSVPPWAASKPAPLPDVPAAARTATGPASSPAAVAPNSSRPAPAWAASRPAPTPAATDKAASPPAVQAKPAPAPVPPAAPQPVAGAHPMGVPAVEAAAPHAPADSPSPAASAASTRAKGPDKVLLRNEPAAMETPSAAEASDGSYESLFRSTGELDPVTAHPSGLDIVLDDDEARRAQADATDSQLLSFVQDADRAARWQRPAVRAALGVAAIVLSLTLVAQIALAERDLVAVRWPAARPWLTAMCDALNCRVEPLRRIDRLAVESSGLTRIGEGQVYRLAMVLRNRGEWPLLLPAVDLTLSDSGGALVSRRVLTAGDLAAPANTIEAGQELPLQVLLRSTERPVTGYTIEIFYP